MRTLLLPSLLLCGAAATAQTYVPFPTDTAVWNGLYHWNGSPDPEEQYSIPYQYALGGDTAFNGTSYTKLQYSEDGTTWAYYGALREDASRNIWLFPPEWAIQVGEVAPQVPNDPVEIRLYTFDNLSVGMALDLGSQTSTITVTGIDSVLVQDSYRKRYTIQNTDLLQPDHWIEGIGSTVDLLSPFLYEFEWFFTTRCFQAPGVAWENPDDGIVMDCDIVMATTEVEPALSLMAVPNPGSDVLYLNGLPPSARTVELLDAMGRSSLRVPAQPTGMDVRGLPAGVYSIRVLGPQGPERVVGRWVKE